MVTVRFLGGLAMGFIFGWVPPELIAWLRDAPTPGRGDATGRRIGKQRRVSGRRSQ